MVPPGGPLRHGRVSPQKTAASAHHLLPSVSGRIQKLWGEDLFGALEGAQGASSFNSPPLRPSPLTRGVLEPKSGTQGPAGPSGFPEVRVPHSPGRSCPSSPGGRGRPCPFLTAKAPGRQPPPPAVHKPAPRSRARCLLIGPTTANPEPLSAVTSRLRCPGIGCGAVSVAPLPTTRTTWRRKGVVIPS